jgi:alanyl-tRNA synthetase
MMSSGEIRKKFLEFFKERRHTIVSSSSLIPDDPSVLLTTAGMQQFKRYYTGELDAIKDFGAPRVASIQKCFRTSDIDEVGDETHLTFFEMLGHFSFGDYFKKETIEWTYELLTKVFDVPKERISATVFEGDAAVPFDKESFLNWSKLLPQERVRKGPRKDNFWGPAGAEGPCGACNEVYVDDTEVATLVFMEYYCRSGKTLEPLAKKGVDVGWGFERLVRVVQNAPTIFETDLFAPITRSIIEIVGDKPIQKIRIITDHLKAATFLVGDGIEPSNTDRGYVLRRLIRRAMVMHYKFIGAGIDAAFYIRPVKEIVNIYKGVEQYKGLAEKEKYILEVIRKETEKFSKTLGRGLKELEKMVELSGRQAFDLYQSFGLPPEVAYEFKPFSWEEFNTAKEEHTKVSMVGAEKKFGGHGLALNTGELKVPIGESRILDGLAVGTGSEEEIQKVTRLHTATHLLQKALREVLGNEIRQMGSDVTPERTRFDFSFSRKMTPEELQKVEEIVNQKIKEDLPVQFIELPKAEAEKTGALFFFKEKYPEKVKVYYIGDSFETAWSKEFCGGPHVSRTGEIGKFKITKEEAVGAGVRRIRAIVE